MFVAMQGWDPMVSRQSEKFRFGQSRKFLLTAARLKDGTNRDEPRGTRQVGLVKTGRGWKHHAAQGGRKDGGQRPLGKNVAKADEKARGRGGGACFARPCIEPEDP